MPSSTTKSSSNTSHAAPVQARALAPELFGAAAQLAGLLESAMDAIISVNTAQRIVLYNRAAETMFGWPAEKALGERLSLLMPQRFHAAHVQHVQQFGAKGVTSRRMGDGTVLQGLRASGEEFPMEASISQLGSGDAKLFTVILRDVSERVRAQDEMHAFATEAHAILEAEKRRIARELHDELAQSLTVVKMDAMWARETLGESVPQVHAKLGEMLEVIDGMVASTRRIAADLRPLMLDDLGLQPALEWLAHNFSKRTGAACDLVTQGDLELGEPYATAVFRIVQECLANTAKHADATQVHVRITRQTHVVLLEVQDDGNGFAVNAPRKPNSLGLMGLRERVRLLKGSMVLESEPGQGTRVAVQLPLTSTGATA